MEYTQLIPLHIAAGAVGLLSGAAAAIFKKGSRRHRLAGNVFFVSMLAMSASGAIVAWFKPAMASVVAGLLTFYLVATGWATIKRRAGGSFDWLALAFAVSVAALGLSSGLEALGSENGAKDGFPAAIYFVFGGIAALAALLDVKVIGRRGIAGAQRIVRHLWRMLFGLLMATSSFFLGQAQLFPEPIRKTGVLVLPVVLVILVLVFWLVRVLFTQWHQNFVRGVGIKLAGFRLLSSKVRDSMSSSAPPMV